MLHYDIATRASALLLRLVLELDNKTIESLTSLKPYTVDLIAQQVLERGFDPIASPPIILDIYVQDTPRSSRPRKQEQYKNRILEKVYGNRYSREMIYTFISNELLNNAISPMIVWCILRAAGIKKTKPIRKLGLTDKIRRDRFEFCLLYKDWTLEN
jgi:hypothetical protein